MPTKIISSRLQTKNSPPHLTYARVPSPLHNIMVLYGQIVIGAPGSGKTTYCDGMQQYLRLLGRDCWVVNLDPANEVPPNNNTATTVTTDDANDTMHNDNTEKNTTRQIPSTIEETEEEEINNSNTQLPYETILDVCQDIISLDSVMENLHLGPNGGLLYCMEYIEHHLDELLTLLKERLGIHTRGEDSSNKNKAYLLFDLPGQIELTAHSGVIGRIAARIAKEMDVRLACVQLVDAAVCLPDVSKFIGASLVCTCSMLRMELPCVNVLSKMDLLSSSSLGMMSTERQQRMSDQDSDDDYAEEGVVGANMPFNLDFFAQCHDLHRLVDYLDSNPIDTIHYNSNIEEDEEEYLNDPEYQKARDKTRNSNFYKKYRKLHHELCDLVEDYGLLSFLPLSIQDAESVGRVLARIDKCNGYVFVRDINKEAATISSNGGKNNTLQDVFSSAIVADSEWGTGVLSDVQEKYLGNTMFREEIAELKKK